MDIETFLTVAEELHFARAAAALRVTPSQVTKRIQRLERHVGGPVFVRSSAHVALTALGAQLRGDLTEVQARLDGAVARARARLRRLPDPIRLGFVEAFGGGELDQVVTQLELAAPDVDVQPVEVPAYTMIAALESSEVHLLLTWSALSGCDSRLEHGAALGQRARMLLVGPEHPLAGRDVVDAEELTDVTLTSWEVGPEYAPLREATSPSSTPGGRPIRHDEQGGRTLTETALRVARGSLAHLTINGMPRLENDPAIRLIPVSGLPPIEYALVWRGDLVDPAVSAAARSVVRSPRMLR